MKRGSGAIGGVIFDVVGSLGVPFGREWGVKFRQRESLIQVSGDQAQALRYLSGRQSFPRVRLSTGEPAGKSTGLRMEEGTKSTKGAIGDRRSVWSARWAFTGKLISVENRDRCIPGICSQMGDSIEGLLWLPLILAVLNKATPRVSDSKSPTVFLFFFTGDVFFHLSKRLKRAEPPVSAGSSQLNCRVPQDIEYLCSIQNSPWTPLLLARLLCSFPMYCNS